VQGWWRDGSSGHEGLEAFKKAYHGTRVESVNRTEIAGLFEVVTGGNLLYFAPDGNYLIFGEIFTPQGKNITAKRREELTANRLKGSRLMLAVRIGNGRNKVIEFTDPDCPFCRKASRFFKGAAGRIQICLLCPPGPAPSGC
jgi:thiol:disulfide interchange protein DsbC